MNLSGRMVEILTKYWRGTLHATLTLSPFKFRFGLNNILCADPNDVSCSASKAEVRRV